MIELIALESAMKATRLGGLKPPPPTMSMVLQCKSFSTYNAVGVDTILKEF